MKRLIVIGRGLMAEKVAALAGPLGYDELRLSEEAVVLESDDHVVIAEDNPDEGRALLLEVAHGERMPAYLGFAAPHREGWKALVWLAASDVPKARIDQISSPAGVDVGAETPDEVAIAIAAELVAIRHGRPCPSAGLDIGAAKKVRGVEARPRRLIGNFGRPELPDDDDSGGRN
jgi:xanthine/CO dehydrogenase XdhC/CoxF family maturation factor